MPQKLKNKKIGLLCTVDGPILSFFIEALLNNGYDNICLIADLRGFSNDDLIRFKERTNNTFHSRKLTLGDFIEYKIPVYFVNSHNADGCINHIASENFNLLINAGTPRKLSSKFLSECGCDVLNVHPGVLPDYRGATCVEWAILNDDPIGNSSHFMTEEYDAGPIIKVEKYKFKHGCSYSDIRSEIYKNSIRLMLKSVSLIFENNLNTKNMDPQTKEIKPYLPISKKDMNKVLKKIKNNLHPSICLPKVK